MAKVFIFGSCVSRDTLERHPELGELEGYVARQSWISTMRPWPVPESEPGLESPFQIRQLRGDLEGNGAALLARALDLVNLVLIDLVDERLGVTVCGDGRAATLSSELRASAWGEAMRAESFPVEFGNDEHFAEWWKAASAIAEIVEEHGAWERVVVLAPAFAVTAAEGGASESLGRSSDEWNSLYERYYDALEELGFDVVRLGVDEVRQAADHEWGPAPFHYDDATYEALAKAALGN